MFDIFWMRTSSVKMCCLFFYSENFKHLPHALGTNCRSLARCHKRNPGRLNDVRWLWCESGRCRNAIILFLRLLVTELSLGVPNNEITSFLSTTAICTHCAMATGLIIFSPMRHWTLDKVHLHEMSVRGPSPCRKAVFCSYFGSCRRDLARYHEPDAWWIWNCIRI